MNVNNCTKDIVVLLELTSISGKDFTIFSDARVNVVQLEISWRILDFSFVKYDFQNFIF